MALRRCEKHKKNNFRIMVATIPLNATIGSERRKIMMNKSENCVGQRKRRKATFSGTLLRTTRRQNGCKNSSIIMQNVNTREGILLKIKENSERMLNNFSHNKQASAKDFSNRIFFFFCFQYSNNYRDKTSDVTTGK